VNSGLPAPSADFAGALALTAARRTVSVDADFDLAVAGAGLRDLGTGCVSLAVLAWTIMPSCQLDRAAKKLNKEPNTSAVYQA
jgi:hypothetical protein